MNSTKSVEPNPLSEIINMLPWEATMVSLEMLDDIRRIIYDTCGYEPFVSNQYIMLLLLKLQEAGMCLVEPVKTSLGQIYLVIRK